MSNKHLRVGIAAFCLAVIVAFATTPGSWGYYQFKLGNFEVQVTGDRCEYEGKLAGSVLTLDRAVRNITQFASWSLQKAIRLATLNPARVLGKKDIGLLAPGARADLVVLSSNGEVQRTIIGGVI